MDLNPDGLAPKPVILFFFLCHPNSPWNETPAGCPNGCWCLVMICIVTTWLPQPSGLLALPA